MLISLHQHTSTSFYLLEIDPRSRGLEEHLGLFLEFLRVLEQLSLISSCLKTTI